MSTHQKYVGRDSHATENTPLCSGHQYRTKIYLLVARIAQASGLDESQIWHNVYARLQSHYGVYIHALPRKYRESLLRVAERHDLLEQVYQCAKAEQNLLLAGL